MPSTEVKRRLSEDVAMWQADGIIDDATRDQLRVRYDTPGFGLITAVKYLGITGGMFAAMGLLGMVAALASSEMFGALITAGVSGFLAWGGLRLGRDPRARYEHSSKVVLALGVIGWACAVGLAVHALHLPDHSLGVVVGFGVLPLVFVIGYRERNGFLVLLGLLGVFHWVGSWSRMISRSTYSFEVDEPRLMAPLALAVFFFGVFRKDRFSTIYQTVALIYFNLSLLIMSIYPRKDAPTFIFVFTVAALAQIVAGARLKSPLTIGFGVTACAIDLFTRYFEHMWDKLDQGLFFVVGGVLLMGFGAAVERAWRRWKP